MVTWTNHRNNWTTVIQSESPRYVVIKITFRSVRKSLVLIATQTQEDTDDVAPSLTPETPQPRDELTRGTEQPEPALGSPNQTRENHGSTPDLPPSEGSTTSTSTPASNVTHQQHQVVIHPGTDNNLIGTM